MRPTVHLLWDPCICQWGRKAACLSACVSGAVRSAVSKLITVIRLKRGVQGSTWPQAFFLQPTVWACPCGEGSSYPRPSGEPVLLQYGPVPLLMISSNSLGACGMHTAIQQHPCCLNDFLNCKAPRSQTFPRKCRRNLQVSISLDSSYHVYPLHMVNTTCKCLIVFQQSPHTVAEWSIW